jgi:hypothetical protein
MSSIVKNTIIDAIVSTVNSFVNITTSGPRCRRGIGEGGVIVIIIIVVVIYTVGAITNGTKIRRG